MQTAGSTTLRTSSYLTEFSFPFLRRGADLAAVCGCRGGGGGGAYLRRTPPSSDALRHSGGESRRCTSPTVTLYLDVEDSSDRRPGTEQNTSPAEEAPDIREPFSLSWSLGLIPDNTALRVSHLSSGSSRNSVPDHCPPPPPFRRGRRGSAWPPREARWALPLATPNP